MKKVSLILVVMFLLTLATASLATADAPNPPAPLYGCPDSFELHPADMDHMGDMDHHHVGLAMDKADMNGDGWICMKHVGVDDNNHVHIDNNFPFAP